MNVCVIIRLALVDIPDKMCEDLSYDRNSKIHHIGKRGFYHAETVIHLCRK